MAKCLLFLMYFVWYPCEKYRMNASPTIPTNSTPDNPKQTEPNRIKTQTPPLSHLHNSTCNSLIERVESASQQMPQKTKVAEKAPVTVQEYEQANMTPKSQLVTEQRPPSEPLSGVVGGQAYDGAVSTGSVGLQVVEGLAVLAAIPAILSVGKLK